MTAAVLTPEERPSLCEVWRRAAAQFASDTNLAGVNNASRARHPLRRLVWCSLWLTGLVVSLNDVSLLVSDFLTYPVSTSYSIAYDSAVTFPAVTVCNQNSVMCTDLMQQLFAEPDDSLILDLVQRSACLSLIPGLCMPMKLMFFEFFGVLSTPEYGNCFTFNSNISSAADREAGQRVASMVGPNTGLSLVLFVDTNNYMPSTVSQTRGARVAIHPSDVTPLMAETGMEVSPTSLTSISITETRIVRMPYPYTSHCISTWADSGLEPYGVDPTTGVVGPSQARYTLAECNRMCLQHHLVKNCGCHDPLYPLEFTVDGELQDVGPACDLSFGSE
ncbi:amiloride-sensitive sodium channel subunit alpha-like [Amphibalanus amphitrite]|uniref:amiloride-sensitive sodium channel subunit alpha-like n=1 Tax=Amphibalanus amphitrite TaxID=1232801 RepID=UPI001C927801|nr:amiloride-sensitive sodium channel subunit alpha-like [Amphibalanus amphitrite]